MHILVNASSILFNSPLTPSVAIGEPFPDVLSGDIEIVHKEFSVTIPSATIDGGLLFSPLRLHYSLGQLLSRSNHAIVWHHEARPLLAVRTERNFTVFVLSFLSNAREIRVTMPQLESAIAEFALQLVGLLSIAEGVTPATLELVRETYAKLLPQADIISAETVDSNFRIEVLFSQLEGESHSELSDLLGGMVGRLVIRDGLNRDVLPSSSSEMLIIGQASSLITAANLLRDGYFQAFIADGVMGHESILILRRGAYCKLLHPLLQNTLTVPTEHCEQELRRAYFTIKNEFLRSFPDGAAHPQYSEYFPE